MNKLKIWLQAARLRTLPLSVAGIIVGSSMAITKNSDSWNWIIFLLAIGTTIGFQIISNFANDYGDGVKGTDNEHRIGPKRALQSGLLTKKQLKKGIILAIVITAVLMILLLYRAFGLENLPYFLLFFLLGIGAIIAAIKYTVGDKAYGYSGKGDLFVFVFFGLVSVIGSYLLFSVPMHFGVVFPAIGIGCLSVAVLNLNNMRDHDNDKEVGKYTLVVKMGLDNAKRYHLSLLLIALLSFLLYLYTNWYHWTNTIFLIGFVPLLIHFNKIIRYKNARNLDPELKKVALSTFAISILFWIGYQNFL